MGEKRQVSHVVVSRIRLFSYFPLFLIPSFGTPTFRKGFICQLFATICYYQIPFRVIGFAELRFDLIRVICIYKIILQSDI